MKILILAILFSCKILNHLILSGFLLYKMLKAGFSAVLSQLSLCPSIKFLISSLGSILFPPSLFLYLFQAANTEMFNKPQNFQVLKQKLKRLATERDSQQKMKSKLPKIQKMHARSLSKKKSDRKNMSSSREAYNISYIRRQNQVEFRNNMRDFFSKAIYFELKNQQSKPNTEFTFMNIVRDLKEPVKSFQYSRDISEFLHNIVLEIFGKDFTIPPRSLLFSQGDITRAYYVFFTGVTHQPTSLCCKSLVYMKISDHNLSINRYSKKQWRQEDEQFIKTPVVISKLVCSGCQKTLIKIKILDNNNEGNDYSRENMKIQVQRQKFSMFIMVASGKYKRFRIDEAVQKEKDFLPSTINLELENIKPRLKSKTLALKRIGAQQNH